MFPLPNVSNLSFLFLFLFLGSVVTQTESDSPETLIDNIRAHHRSLYQLSNALGGKCYSYDTITSEVSGETAWRDHYGEGTREHLCAAKRITLITFFAQVSRCGNANQPLCVPTDVINWVAQNSTLTYNNSGCSALTHCNFAAFHFY